MDTIIDLIVSPYTILIALVVGWQYPPLRRAILFLIFLVPAAFIALWGVAAWILWRPVKWLYERIVPYLPIDDLALRILERASYGKASTLAQGDREAVAQSKWPEDRFPELYSDLPEDIERPPFEDGKIIGGEEITWLADRHLTETAYLSAARAGFLAAMVIFVGALINLLLGVGGQLLEFIPALMEGQTPVVEQWPGDEPVNLSTWQLVAANFGAAFADLATNAVGYIIQSLFAIPFAIGVGVAFALVVLRSWMSEKAEPYRLITKDADVRWPYRSETRALLRQTFNRQIEHATGYLKDAKTYPVGQATGTLRARGDLTAPTPHQTLKLDRESLSQHLMVFGGTGEGKTSALLKPLLRQILGDKSFGAFIADAKGVFWKDAQGVAENVGRGADVIVLGTGPDQQGLNPIASLTPTQVAATLRSVLRQMGKSGGDDFWPDMAATILRHALTIGHAYAQTDAGQKEAKDTGVNAYSLWWAYRAVTLSGSKGISGPLRTALDALRKRQEDDQAAWEKAKTTDDQDAAASITEAGKKIFSAELNASIQYLEGAWVSMAADTKTGIVANVTQLLDGFSGSPVLRERFASGSTVNTASLRDALNGKIMLNALSTIEDGLPARLTTILIKTALYREARVRESEMKRDDTQASPQDNPCLVMMDEVQELATADPASGLSDASFWNVARSSGMVGVFATQTIAALTQALGQEAADNFIQQTRSRVFFRTEERATVDYACWCAGEYERNRVYEDEQKESLEFRQLIDNWSPLDPIDEDEDIKAGPGAFFDTALGLLKRDRLLYIRPNRRATYGADRRFIATDGTPGSGGGSAGNSALMGSLQAATWRAEDLTRSYRTEGNERVPALTPADMIHMGRWHAFAQIQRAGAVRQDIVSVVHDFG